MTMSVGSTSRAAACDMDEQAIIGREVEIKMLLDKLCHGESKLEIVGIVGMPGLGKSTVVKNLYTHKSIVHQFNVCGWTSVGPPKQMYIDILMSAFNRSQAELVGMEENNLCLELYQNLKRKRYMIIMEDIWDYGAWKNMKDVFPNDNNKSRIVFTTRLVDVAYKLTNNLHYLRFLEEEESWELLQKKVLSSQERCSNELVEIGKEIARKCKGVPLAIHVLAGLLSNTDRSVDKWRTVCHGVSEYILSDMNEYINTLAQSYNHLPEHLKKCFLYFAALPDDYDIAVKKLVCLWVAEGLVQKEKGKEVEDVADGYIKSLADRSLVMIVERKSSGGIKSCLMHDVLRVLSVRKASENNFLQRFNSSTRDITQLQPLRISLGGSCDFRLTRVYHSKSFLWLNGKTELGNDDALLLFRNFQGLRVLDLLCVRIKLHEELGEKLTNLTHLQYLGIMFNGPFPRTISRLNNLQYLHVIWCNTGTCYLPADIWKMVNLRLLRIYSHCYIEPEIHSSSQYKLNVQYISLLGTGDGVLPMILQKCPNLRKLGIWKHRNSTTDELLVPPLHKMNILEALKVIHYSNMSSTLVGVKFPRMLKKLSLERTRIQWKDMIILGKLKHLMVLKLGNSSFEGCLWQTSGQGFPTLKFLKISGIYHWYEWETRKEHFPVLEQLIVHKCDSLERIPLNIGDIHTLKEIDVKGSSAQVISSAHAILLAQQDFGNEELVVLS